MRNTGLIKLNGNASALLATALTTNQSFAVLGLSKPLLAKCMGAEQGFDNAVALAECIDDTETIDEHEVNTLLQKYPNGVPNGITAIELKRSVDEAGDFDVMMPSALIFIKTSQGNPAL